MEKTKKRKLSLSFGETYSNEIYKIKNDKLINTITGQCAVLFIKFFDDEGWGENAITFKFDPYLILKIIKNGRKEVIKFTNKIDDPDYVHSYQIFWLDIGTRFHVCKLLSWREDDEDSDYDCINVNAQDFFVTYENGVQSGKYIDIDQPVHLDLFQIMKNDQNVILFLPDLVDIIYEYYGYGNKCIPHSANNTNSTYSPYNNGYFVDFRGKVYTSDLKSMIVVNIFNLWKLNFKLNISGNIMNLDHNKINEIIFSFDTIKLLFKYEVLHENEQEELLDIICPERKRSFEEDEEDELIEHKPILTSDLLVKFDIPCSVAKSKNGFKIIKWLEI